ncbi:hypothetical protein ACQ5SO_07470 [Rhodovulum sp. DZ06]|uniref:hypothetical protein n=1 Tax=Rhodovulum sp. DZ06 TaxID=3425126 RepID=UPI003D34A43C
MSSQGVGGANASEAAPAKGHAENETAAPAGNRNGGEDANGLENRSGEAYPSGHAPASADTWARILDAARRLRQGKDEHARVCWALAALLSLSAGSREALIDHLVKTWGRDVMQRRLDAAWAAEGQA